MSFLLDTNVLSELRRGKKANMKVRQWLDHQAPESLYVSVMTLGEIQEGLERMRRKDPPQAVSLERWLEGLMRLYEDRLLPIDGRVASEWGRLRAVRSVPVVDALLAATARVHRLTLVTRNENDFLSLDVPVVNPFK